MFEKCTYNNPQIMEKFKREESRELIDLYTYSLLMGLCFIRYLLQAIRSTANEANEQYLASTLNFAKVFCFIEDQLIQLEQRKT